MPHKPPHIDWLVDTGERPQTVDGREIEVWSFNHTADAAILSAWADHPFRRKNAAAAILDEDVYAHTDLTTTDASDHPNPEGLRLIVVKGLSLMDLVTALYDRAADEA